MLTGTACSNACAANSSGFSLFRKEQFEQSIQSPYPLRMDQVSIPTCGLQVVLCIQGNSLKFIKINQQHTVFLYNAYRWFNEILYIAVCT